MSPLAFPAQYSWDVMTARAASCFESDLESRTDLIKWRGTAYTPNVTISNVFTTLQQRYLATYTVAATLLGNISPTFAQSCHSTFGGNAHVTFLDYVFTTFTQCCGNVATTLNFSLEFIPFCILHNIDDINILSGFVGFKYINIWFDLLVMYSVHHLLLLGILSAKCFPTVVKYLLTRLVTFRQLISVVRVRCSSYSLGFFFNQNVDNSPCFPYIISNPGLEICAKYMMLVFYANNLVVDQATNQNKYFLLTQK